MRLSPARPGFKSRRGKLFQFGSVSEWLRRQIRNLLGFARRQRLRVRVPPGAFWKTTATRFELARRAAPYPLGHRGPTKNERFELARAVGSIRTRGRGKNDTDEIRTRAGGAHWLSKPTP